MNSEWQQLPNAQARNLGVLFTSVCVCVCVCVYTRARKSCSVVSDSLPPHGLYSQWNSLGQNTGVDSLSLGDHPPLGFNQTQISLTSCSQISLWRTPPLPPKPPSSCRPSPHFAAQPPNPPPCPISPSSPISVPGGNQAHLYGRSPITLLFPQGLPSSSCCSSWYPALPPNLQPPRSPTPPLPTSPLSHTCACVHIIQAHPQLLCVPNSLHVLSCLTQRNNITSSKNPVLPPSRQVRGFFLCAPKTPSICLYDNSRHIVL